MNGRQLHLDYSNFEKRKPPVQTAFEESNLSLLVAYYDIVHQAHKKTQEKFLSEFQTGEMDKNLPAVLMNSFMRQSIIKQFPYYCRKATRSRFKMITPSNECILIKKLNAKKRPSNIQTEANDHILFQVITNPKDKRPYIFLGYTCSKDFSVITGVYAVCIEGENIVWESNISVLRNAITKVVNISTNTNPVRGLKEGTIKIKRKTKD